MIKKLFIAIIIVAAIIITAVFIYRYQIFQYSAETIIRKLLPDYVRIDKMNFDLKNNEIILTDFKVLNPEGYSTRYLVEVRDIRCKYRMKGANILDGIEVLTPDLAHLALNMERLRDGRVNLQDMQKYLEKSPKKTVMIRSKWGEAEAATPSMMVGNKTLPDILKLPETFSLTDGKIVFVDRMVSDGTHTLTFENVNAKIGMKLNSSYTSVVYLTSTGQGDVNGDSNQVVRWTLSFNPTTSRLTMSSRFDVYNVDILPFEPYYDRYSPFVFKTGRFSGPLIFDFDNGNIGSSDEVHLSNIKFWIKQGYENAAFWDTTVPDLVKYFTSPYGEIVFDFKIKGDMYKPQFYLGPISKQALTSMAVDKISSAIQQASGPSSGATNKTQAYIDMFKSLINKK